MCLAPFVADGVDIAVADAGSFDVDNYVVSARLTTLNDFDLERCFGAGFLECFYLNAHFLDITYRYFLRIGPNAFCRLIVIAGSDYFGRELSFKSLY